mgnify:CR=1 FL=1
MSAKVAQPISGAASCILFPSPPPSRSLRGSAGRRVIFLTAQACLVAVWCAENPRHAILCASQRCFPILCRFCATPALRDLSTSPMLALILRWPLVSCSYLPQHPRYPDRRVVCLPLTSGLEVHLLLGQRVIFDALSAPQAAGGACASAWPSLSATGGPL